MVEQSPVIAIDGGAGTGKTTSAALVAERLGFCYVDSGAIYRAVALALKERGVIDPSDPALPVELDRLALRIDPTPAGFHVFLGEREVRNEIRTPEVSQLSSKLAVRAEVRAAVGRLLRDARSRGALVVEGRDIGTAVFPDADLKVFMSAELDVRAVRRQGDLARQGIAESTEQVRRDLAERDARDSSRSESPLRRADDAIDIDTSRISIEGQVDAILAAWRDAEARRGSSH